MKKGLIVALGLSLLCVAWGGPLSAQGYRIDVTLAGLKDTSCILGHYNYSNQQFLAKDTARADAKGHLVFQDSKPLPGGLYLVLLPGNRRWVEVVYSGKETDFSLSTDTLNVVESMVVMGSEENRLFYEYQKGLSKIREEAAGLSAQGAAPTDPKMKAVQQKFTDFYREFTTEHGTTFTSKLLKASMEPEIPPAPSLPNGKKDSLWVFNYYKTHYWDNFDFSDERLIRAPFLKPKLERYIRELVVQVPDSITKDADALIKKAAGNKELKAYIVYFVTSEYENPKVVGTEGVFVHMAEKYYLTGQMDVSDDAKRRIAEKVAAMKPLLVDQVIPNLTLADMDRKPVSIHGVKSDYTVLFFYSPTCGHCKEAAPVIKDFYDKNKAKGVKILAIATEQNAEEWKKYVREYKLEEILHGYDYTLQTDYRLKYDVFSTPTIYVLDKNKKIIARRMPAEQLDDFFNFYLKNHPKEAPKSASTGVKANGGK